MNFSDILCLIIGSLCAIICIMYRIVNVLDSEHYYKKLEKEKKEEKKRLNISCFYKSKSYMTEQNMAQWIDFHCAIAFFTITFILLCSLSELYPQYFS